MNNLLLSNFRISLNDYFFPDNITTKYEDFLFHKNYPFKTMKGYLHETIQELNIPGLNISGIKVEGLNNTGINGIGNSYAQVTSNRQYPGTLPINDIIEDTVVSIVFRNTLINYIFCYEILHKFYKRQREVTDFGISLIMMDSAEIPVIRFNLSDCYINKIPGLNFSYVQNFNQSKTFEIGFAFNKFDVDFCIPSFDLEKIKL